MTDAPQEVFQAMNASRILVAILTELGSVEVPTKTYMESNNEDKELNVSYNDENLTFTFSLRGNNERSSNIN